MLLSVEGPLPRTLHLQLDNTTGQNKNSTVIGFLGYLVEKKVLDTVRFVCEHNNNLCKHIIFECKLILMSIGVNWFYGN